MTTYKVSIAILMIYDDIKEFGKYVQILKESIRVNVDVYMSKCKYRRFELGQSC